MARTVLALVAALVASGCLGDDEPGVTFSDGDAFTFSYQGGGPGPLPPATPDPLLVSWSWNVTVPEGVAVLDVTVTVSLQELDPRLAERLQLVRASLLDPHGSSIASLQVHESTSVLWREPMPMAGDWTVEVEARGEGRVDVAVLGGPG